MVECKYEKKINIEEVTCDSSTNDKLMIELSNLNAW